jgi:putative YpdA family bacillithiol system oxidoreductase
MGLIRNAFEQGRQCVEGIVAEKKSSVDGILDVLIVGCGPAGLSAALNCSHHGLRFEVLEKGDVGGAVRTYPRKKLVMTSPLNIPGYGKLSFREIVKEDLVKLWDEMISKADLNVRTFEGVDRVDRRADGIFEVHTPKNTYLTQRVILAIGKRGVPRKLGVPGEEGANVSYSLREPDVFEGDRVTVVGGGDSAVEAALSLADQAGTRVVLSYRKDRLSRVKEDNLKRIEASIAAGQVDVRWSTTLTEIGADRIRLRHETGEETEVDSDYVLIFAGGEMPTGFLKACGIEIDTKFGEPV